MSHFDKMGDLWIEISAVDIPASFPSACRGPFTISMRYNTHVTSPTTEINLTAYLKHLISGESDDRNQ